MYSFHGAKPPALHLINFLLFIWLKLLLPFFLSFFRATLLSGEEPDCPELLVNHHSSEGLNYLVLSVLVFVTGLAREEAQSGSAAEMNFSWIRKLNETAPISREKSRGDAVGGGSLAARRPSAAPLQRLQEAED